MPSIFAVKEHRSAKTIKKEFSVSGLCIHSGKEVCVRCIPQKTGGIIFKKNDSTSSGALIKAQASAVCDTSRCTVISEGSHSISTIEHLLSALKAFEVDHLLIEVSGPELPILDGSSREWVKYLAGNIAELDSQIPVYQLNEAVFLTHGSANLVALPYDELVFSYTLHYPNHPMLSSQFYSFKLSSESYVENIAPCRTFALYEEVKPLLDKGLIQGGSLDNAVVVKQNEVLCSGGLRFDNEMCRHKILDLIGDFSLANISLSAHIISIGSGHASNVAFAEKISNAFMMEKAHV